jgi:hypothetical protein
MRPVTIAVAELSVSRCTTLVCDRVPGFCASAVVPAAAARSTSVPHAV